MAPDPKAPSSTAVPDHGAAPGSPDSNPRYELGVLFVHGIGEQQEGDTLTTCSEPVIRWIREWISGHGSRQARASGRTHDRFDGVTASYASLFPSRRQSTGPAHCVLNIQMTGSGPDAAPRQQSWLFAECWWGEQVQSPPVFDRLAWMFSRGPWITLAHATERAYQFTRPRYSAKTHWVVVPVMTILDATRWRYLAWGWALLRFLAIVAVMQTLLVLAATLALVPIPVVRRYVSSVLQRATLILGDSYGLVANDTQRAAILARFRETVSWLQCNCDKLVIVAHSQGAAVVDAALCSYDDREQRRPAIVDDYGRVVSAEIRPLRRPELLLTFGAGLAKLAQLRQCELSYRSSLLAAGWIVPTVVVAALLHIWLRFGTGSTVEGLGILVFALYVAFLVCAMASIIAWGQTRVRASHDFSTRKGPRRWIDLYASSDPVPQGSLTDYLPTHATSPDGDELTVVSERIVNRRSLLSDHNSYWDNRPEFVSRVVAELDREVNLLDLPDLKSEAFERATRHHHLVIGLLSLTWWANLLSLSIVAVAQFDRLASLGQQIIAVLRSGPLKPLADYVVVLGDVISWVTRELTDSVPAEYPQLGHAIVVIGGVLLLGYLWWRAVVVLLVKWDSAQLIDYLEGKNWWGRYGTWIVWPFIVLSAALPAVFCWARLNGSSPAALIVQAAVWPISLLFALSQIAVLAAEVITASRKAGWLLHSRRQ